MQCVLCKAHNANIVWAGCCSRCVDDGLGMLRTAKICREAADRAVKLKLKERKQGGVDCPTHGSEKMIKIGNKRVCESCGFDPRL